MSTPSSERGTSYIGGCAQQMATFPNQRAWVSLLVIGLVYTLVFSTSPPASGHPLPLRTIRVNRAFDGGKANRDSGSSDFSRNGRFVAFESNATNLVKHGDNPGSDIFVFDRKKKTTELISKRFPGRECYSNYPYSSCESWVPAISADGRFVVFASMSSALVKGDNNGLEDIFIRDRRKDKTVRVSVNSSGHQANSDSDDPAISANGRYIAFESSASNLSPRDYEYTIDVFVHDLETHETFRITRKRGGPRSLGSFYPALSGTGRFVTFSSDVPHLVRRDRDKRDDIFVFDRRRKKTSRVSVSPTNRHANGDSPVSDISDDGKVVTYASYASNLGAKDLNHTLDIYAYNRRTKRTELVSRARKGQAGNHGSEEPSLSADGRFVSFASEASNLVGRDTNHAQDGFVYDRLRNKVRRVTIGPRGREANAGSNAPTASRDGRWVVFDSWASNLVRKREGSTWTDDVFLRGPFHYKN